MQPRYIRNHGVGHLPPPLVRSARTLSTVLAVRLRLGCDEPPRPFPCIVVILEKGLPGQGPDHLV